MKINWFLLAIMALFFAGCEKQSDKNDNPEFSSLNEKSFIFIIDRIAMGPEVAFPNDTLSESDYTDVTGGIQYEITFSDDGFIVTIKSDTDIVIGERISDGTESKHYDIVEGLFAGGRFIVWIINDHFEAEYTIYGSGVPIIRSERGRLEEVSREKREERRESREVRSSKE